VLNIPGITDGTDVTVGESPSGGYLGTDNGLHIILNEPLYFKKATVQPNSGVTSITMGIYYNYYAGKNVNSPPPDLTKTFTGLTPLVAQEIDVDIFLDAGEYFLNNHSEDSFLRAVGVAGNYPHSSAGGEFSIEGAYSIAGADVSGWYYWYFDIQMTKIAKITKAGNVEGSDISEVGPTNGLLMYYPLNGDVLDYSGNNYHLTNAGADISTGLRDKNSYLFVRANDDAMRQSLTPTSAYSTQTLSISAWVKLASAQADFYIIAHTHWAAPWVVGLRVSISSTNLQFVTNSVGLNVPKILTVGEWYHIACTYDQTAAVENKKIYLNGKFMGAADYTGNITAQSGVTIGDIGNATANYNFDGNIQDVRVYNRTLTSAEVYTLFKMFNPNGTTQIQINNDASINVFGEIKERL
jgi:hypothetical protein